eukprot:scpid42052/ scgid20547/ 
MVQVTLVVMVVDYILCWPGTRPMVVSAYYVSCCCEAAHATTQQYCYWNQQTDHNRPFRNVQYTRTQSCLIWDSVSTAAGGHALHCRPWVFKRLGLLLSAAHSYTTTLVVYSTTALSNETRERGLHAQPPYMLLHWITVSCTVYA